MKWYIVILTLFTLFGCKDTVEMQAIKEALLLENKKYFNSERAAKILYEDASKYLKYGTFFYPRPQSTLNRYMVIGDEPPYTMKKIAKKQVIRMDKEDKPFYQTIYTDKDNRINAWITPFRQSIRYFDLKNEKMYFQRDPNKYNNNKSTSYTTECSFQYSRDCLTQENGRANERADQPGLSLSVVNKIFKDYNSYYNGKEIIYDYQSKIVKKIDYNHKKVKYYFYDSKKRYEVICDYPNETCKVEHNCDYEHKDGEGRCGLIGEHL